MSVAVQLVIFAYDICDDRRRSRVARLLEREAVRVQDSLFEALLTRPAAERLARAVEALLVPGDRLRAYFVPLALLDGIIAYGGAPVQRHEDCWLL